ncbi:AIPR family protein [Priestia megaterium]|uniref:AIPR family protein n=1 Tax=Priestia megaterium TaxID=1404 RepID=UPI000BFB8BCA|nr:AIPR family protein [Priestia megaterium]PGN04344.1 hypothetical protein CN955_21480 [Priestia megaterium]
MEEYAYLSAFENRDDLKKYGDNAHLLYALDIKERVNDIHTVATTALTDGNDDKKCDLVFIDEDKGVAILAQGYFSVKPNRQSAPANKATDLNGAVSWILSGNLNDIGNKKLKPKAFELRDAIKTGKIHTLELWYVHNSPESENVAKELKTAEKTAHSLIKTEFNDCELITVKSLEVGNSVLENWYNDSQSVISVTDNFELTPNGGYPISTAEWKAYVTTVPATWLYELYQQYGRDKRLFSANVREYLGHRNSDKNINNKIKITATTEQSNFWVYNNGLTALVNNFEVDEENKNLQISGISIVNGAQTTGALGTLEETPSENVYVPIRFVKCVDPAIVEDIIEYNNSQNKIEATDFRSNDGIQKGLRKEFASIEGVFYGGGRRNSRDSQIKSDLGLDYLPPFTVAQALMAFQEKPIIAANKKSEIWINNDLYTIVFNDHTNAGNIILVYSLFRSIETYKLNIEAKNDKTDSDKKLLEFLRYIKSYYMIISAIAHSFEEILDKPIANKDKLSFGNITATEGIKKWEIILPSLLSLLEGSLIEVLNENEMNNKERIKRAIVKFKDTIKFMNKSIGRSKFDEFASELVE